VTLALNDVTDGGIGNATAVDKIDADELTAYHIANCFVVSSRSSFAGFDS
jgi:hypothetical protein